MGRCCSADNTPGAGRPGRRSADLRVGVPAGRTFGLIGPGAGSLRRRRLSCLFTLRRRGCSRQGADRAGQPAPVGSLELRPHVGARAAAAQVRCQAPRLAHSPGGQVETCTPRPLSTRPPGHAIGPPDPALAPPIRPLSSTPLRCAVCRAQIGLHLALRRRPRAWGRRFSDAGLVCC